MGNTTASKIIAFVVLMIAFSGGSFYILHQRTAMNKSTSPTGSGTGVMGGTIKSGVDTSMQLEGGQTKGATTNTPSSTTPSSPQKADNSSASDMSSSQGQINLAQQQYDAAAKQLLDQQNQAYQQLQQRQQYCQDQLTQRNNALAPTQQQINQVYYQQSNATAIVAQKLSGGTRVTAAAEDQMVQDLLSQLNTQLSQLQQQYNQISAQYPLC